CAPTVGLGSRPEATPDAEKADPGRGSARTVPGEASLAPRVDDRLGSRVEALHRALIGRVRLPPRSLAVDEGDPRSVHRVREILRRVRTGQSLGARGTQRVEEERDVDGVRGTQRAVDRAGLPR